MLRIAPFHYSDIELRKLSSDIRKQVFVIEQNVPLNLDFDGLDNISHHYIGFWDEKAVSTARWRQTDKGIKLERFATLSGYRNKGIGKAILRQILKEITQTNQPVYLHSQENAVNFYLKNGFEIVGDEFFEAEIRHFKMVYSLLK